MPDPSADPARPAPLRARRRSRRHVVVAVLGIGALSAAAWWWQQERPARTPGAVPPGSAAGVGAGTAANAAARPAGDRATPTGPVLVEAGRAERMPLRDETLAVGSLRSHQGVMLRPEVSGRVASIGFRDGERVRRGQVLVQLDDALQRAQLQQARAQAAIARTNLQRNRDLVGQGFVSQSAVDQTAAALEVAEAQVALAEAQLGRMRILAPFDGVAGIRQVDRGDYVKDGADLVNVEDTSSMRVDFRLPEHLLARLRPGQAVDVTLDAHPGRSFRGRIEALDAQIDADGRSLLVRARLANEDGALRPGMFARTRVVFAVREQAVVVPEEALVPQGGRQVLVRLVERDGRLVSQRLEARIGLRVPGQVEILEGLAAGDRVVTAGHGPLLRADGVEVRVVDIGVPGPASSPPGDGATVPAEAPASAVPRPAAV